MIPFFIILIPQFKIILIAFSTPESNNRFSGIDKRKSGFQNRRNRESQFTPFKPLLLHTCSTPAVNKFKILGYFNANYYNNFIILYVFLSVHFALRLDELAKVGGGGGGL